MNKRNAIILLSVAIALFITLGTTLAYLISYTLTLDNTFSIGDVSISLSESTGDKYKIIPANPIKKDPKVTVHKNSENCWLFVKIEETSDFNIYMTYEIADGWSQLAGYKNIYYRAVSKSTNDSIYSILKNDTIYTRDNITEEMLNTITDNPRLNFSAYAIQQQTIDTPSVAWGNINAEMEE